MIHMWICKRGHRIAVDDGGVALSAEAIAEYDAKQCEVAQLMGPCHAPMTHHPFATQAEADAFVPETWT